MDVVFFCVDVVVVIYNVDVDCLCVVVLVDWFIVVLFFLDVGFF